MKVTVWVLRSLGDGFDDAQAFSSFEKATDEAIEMTKAEWEKHHSDPMPADWQDAQQDLLDAGNSYLFCEITHHELDLVELIEANKQWDRARKVAEANEAAA